MSERAYAIRHKARKMSQAHKDNRMVLVNGSRISRPRTRKCRSPGSRPKRMERDRPSRNSPVTMTSTTTTNSHFNMRILQPEAAIRLRPGTPRQIPPLRMVIDGTWAHARGELNT